MFKIKRDRNKSKAKEDAVNDLQLVFIVIYNGSRT
jgi:hypothetical protein